MKIRKAIPIVAGCVVVLVVVYVGFLYTVARKPVFDGVRSTYDTEPITGEYPDAQKELGRWVGHVEHGYHVTASQFFTKQGYPTGDALRSFLYGYLSRQSTSYELWDNPIFSWPEGVEGYSPTAGYYAYIFRRTNPIERKFNDDLIAVAILEKPVVPGTSETAVYLYGYFLLKPGDPAESPPPSSPGDAGWVSVDI